VATIACVAVMLQGTEDTTVHESASPEIEADAGSGPPAGFGAWEHSMYRLFKARTQQDLLGEKATLQAQASVGEPSKDLLDSAVSAAMSSIKPATVMEPKTMSHITHRSVSAAAKAKTNSAQAQALKTSWNHVKSYAAKTLDPKTSKKAAKLFAKAAEQELLAANATTEKMMRVQQDALQATQKAAKNTNLAEKKKAKFQRMLQAMEKRAVLAEKQNAALESTNIALLQKEKKIEKSNKEHEKWVVPATTKAAPPMDMMVRTEHFSKPNRQAHLESRLRSQLTSQFNEAVQLGKAQQWEQQNSKTTASGGLHGAVAAGRGGDDEYAAASKLLDSLVD